MGVESVRQKPEEQSLIRKVRGRMQSNSSSQPSPAVAFSFNAFSFNEENEMSRVHGKRSLLTTVK